MTTVVAAVIERDGCVLIAQRKRTGRHPLKWEFPEHAFVRELEEELSIRVKVGPEIGRYEFQYEGRWPIMLMFYRVTEFSGEPKNLDFEQIVWAPRERLRDYDFLEGDTEFLKTYTN